MSCSLFGFTTSVTHVVTRRCGVTIDTALSDGFRRNLAAWEDPSFTECLPHCPLETVTTNGVAVAWAETAAGDFISQSCSQFGYTDSTNIVTRRCSPHSGTW